MRGESGLDRGFSLTIRLYHRNGNPNESRHDLDGPEGFWAPFLSALSEGKATWQDLESRFCSSFPSALMEALRRRFASTGTAESAHKASLASQIVVVLRKIEYSSLDATLLFAPASKTIELFDRNFAYFEAFLETYIPEAVRESLSPGYGVPHYSHQWDAAKNNIEVEIIQSASSASAFATLPSHIDSGAQPRTSADLPGGQKAKWVWILANTSLVVPTLVALALLYVATQQLSERQQAVDHAYIQLIEAQNRIIELLTPSKPLASPESAESGVTPNPAAPADRKAPLSGR